jgi:hypothetical protein
MTTDGNGAPKNQQQAVSTTNLLFLLERLAQHAQPRGQGVKSRVESPITDKQIEEYVSQNVV